MVYYYIFKYNGKILFCHESCNNAARNSYGRVLSRNELSKSYPYQNCQRINMVLENLSNYSRYMGDSIHVGSSRQEMDSIKTVPWLFMPSDENAIADAWGMYQVLQEAGYVKYYSENNKTDLSRVILTEKAWERINKNEHTEDRKTFIAMSYADKENLNEYESMVKFVIGECNCTPIIIRDKEHNNYIPSEIEYEISTSSAIIADLTGQNNGVYYEAGFARGIKIPVIFTCEEREAGEKLENIHFDVRQINTLFWNWETDADKDNFKKRLKRRIKATLG